jgi:hypothetical protein
MVLVAGRAPLLHRTGSSPFVGFPRLPGKQSLHLRNCIGEVPEFRVKRTLGDPIGVERVLSRIGRTWVVWQGKKMPALDTVLLPLCVGLSLLGIIATGLAWRRGRKGRVIQGIALALAPIALYFSGLLRLLWDGVVAIGSWASKIIFSPAVWFGLSLLGLCVVLWVIGGVLARRAPARKSTVTGGSGTAGALPAGSGSSRTGAKQPAPAIDEEMAEIEALLKSRGIE